MKTLPMVGEPQTRIRGCCQTLPEPLDAIEAEHLAAVGRALSDLTRVQMIHMLKAASEPVCVCDFTAAFDLSQATISHHIAKLRDAGLIDSQKHGIWSFYRLRAKHASPIAQKLIDAIP